IVKKGSSFPLYTDRMATVLAEKVGKELIIDEKQCLRLADSNQTAESILAATLDAVIMSQFDRLPVPYQNILSVASCLGQIVEIGGFELTPPELKNIIEDSDRYQFLEIENEESFMDTDDADHKLETINCCFRHISPMYTINESMSYSDRALLNLTAAEYLETILTPEMKTRCRYVQRCAFMEGSQTLTKLEDIYKTLINQNTTTTTTPPPLQIHPLRRACWLSELSFALIGIRNIKDASVVAVEALTLVNSNEPWPLDETAINKKFQKSLARLSNLWILTRGGTIPLTNIKRRDRESSFNTDTNHDIRPSASSLAALVNIEMLCCVIPRAHVDLYQWRIQLTRAAFRFHFHMPILSRLFYASLVKAEGRGTPTFAHNLILGSFELLVKPPMSNSRLLFENYSRWSESRGDTIISESLASLQPTFESLASDPNYFDPINTPNSIILLYRQHLLKLNLEPAEALMDKFRKAMSFWKPYPVSYSSLMFLDSLSKLVNGDILGSLKTLHDAIRNAATIMALMP
ncbi:hypothetical protein HDU76_003487, partial [Blyttiomyces sp. JEL0837]